jgi:hypothetical protein
MSDTDSVDITVSPDGGGGGGGGESSDRSPGTSSHEKHLEFPLIIGDCPSEGLFDPSAGLIPPSNREVSPCFGWRDAPDTFPDYATFADPLRDDPSGFRIDGIVQFFFREDWLIDPGFNPLKHSCITMKWDPCGKLVVIQFDLFRPVAGPAPAVLWERNSAKDQQQRPSSAIVDTAGCPILPPSSSPPSTYEPTAGCLVRFFALRGTYGRTLDSCGPGEPPPSMIPSCSCQQSSDESRCGSVTTYFDAVSMCFNLELKEIDPTLEDKSSEIALRFDSAGNLMRVYFGATESCAQNPCVWNRDDPPEGTSGVVVPLLQFVNDSLTPAPNNNFRLLQVHFDSTGKYKRTCRYATFCGCEIVGPSSSMDFRCPCEFTACITTDGNSCTPTQHVDPTPFAVFGCSKALMMPPPNPDCGAIVQNDIAAGHEKLCTYSNSLGGCVGNERLNASCDASTDPSGEGQSFCLFITEDLCA